MDFLKNFLVDYTLNELVLCLVSGYIFVCIFCFVASVQKPSEYTSSIFINFFVGYILTILFHICPSITKNNIYIDTVLFLIICAIVSFIIAKLYDSKILEKAFDFLQINKTQRKYIWMDIYAEQKDLFFVKCTFSNDKIKVIGQCTLCEENQRYPQIVLTGYQKIRTDNGVILEDYEGDEDRKILIDTARADMIELIYVDNK